MGSPNTVIRGKVSRASRTGSVMGLDSSPNIQPSSGAFQDWEQPKGLNKVPVAGVRNNQKRMMSSGSSIHPMTQWVGQRPHKNSRTRRSNLVSPVSNHAEAQISSQSLATNDFSAKTSVVETSNVDNNNPKFKLELENVSSPFGLSESEESGAGEHKLKEKGIDNVEVALTATHKVVPFVMPTKKNKLLSNESGDGVRRQGRSGRGSSLTRTEIPLVREKLENLSTTKPLQSVKPSSEKNRSKSGRPPSKKLKDRKASIRVGPMINNGPLNYTGESDDDREELLVAANAAHNARSLACSGPFWKKMESIFASVSAEDLSYLKQQLSFAEKLDDTLSQMFGVDFNALGVGVHKEVIDYSGVRLGSHFNQELAETDSLWGRFDMKKSDKVTPLYQRVLSALIEEDEIEESYHHSEGKTLSLQYASDDSHCGSCNQIDIEPKDRDRMESEVESKVDYQMQKNCLLDRVSCDKSVVSNSVRNPSISSPLNSIEQWRGDYDISHSDLGQTSEICSNDLGQLQPRELNVASFSSSDCQYQLLCMDDRLLLELQSIGLYPETLPDLAEGEVIKQDIMDLKEGLYQQIGIKRKNLGKIDEAIQKGRDVERQTMEQVAMDQLIGIAYQKRMACRGSYASKSAVRKISKQVALAFMKRTLARCRKFEDIGNSCFSEPALQDVIFSPPPCNNDAKSVDCVGSGSASNTCNEASHQVGARGSGAVSSTFERYDSLSDNIDRGSSDALQSVIHSSEQASSKHGSVFIKGKKREMLIDDVVGSASSRVTSALDNPVLDGVKGKRSERDRDQNGDIVKSNSVSGASRSSMDSFRSERKTKAKPKQKISHLSTSGSSFHGRLTEATEPACPPAQASSHSVALVTNKISRERGSRMPSNVPQESSKESEEPIDCAKLPLNDLDSMEALDVPNDITEPQDLSTWLNFDDDVLQDYDCVGLEIPMDDLSELNII